MGSLVRMAAVVCGLALGIAALPAQDKKAGTKADKPISDADFVIMAASSGMHEVELGKLAKTNASSADVKKFGERMVEDHTKANKELMDIAKGANLGIPTKMLDEHQKMVDKHRKLTGAEFDRAYAHHAVESHQKSLDLFTNASKNAKNEKLRDFATKTLPTIKEHLAMAKKLEGGKDGKGDKNP